MIAELEFTETISSATGWIIAAATAASSIYNAVKANAANRREHKAREEAAEYKAGAAMKDAHLMRIAELEAQVTREIERAAKIESDWSKRYETNQDFHHKRAEKDQALLFECQEQCSALRATRDFGPILDYMKKQDGMLAQMMDDRREQTKVNSEVFTALRGLSEQVGRLADKVS